MNERRLLVGNVLALIFGVLTGVLPWLLGMFDWRFSKSSLVDMVPYLKARTSPV